MYKTILLLIFTFFPFIFFGCVKRHPSATLQNQPPRTYFWLVPDSVLADGISKQTLHWWGEDPDGIVKAYLLAVVPDLQALPTPDTLEYTFTYKSDSLLSFPIRQARQTFLVALRAVDNSFSPTLPEGIKVRLYPQFYWDVNRNGIYDGGDVDLSVYRGAVDMYGAQQQIPIRNTPPQLHYVSDEADPSVYAEPPKVTFPTASFSWIGTDIDGNETITSYRLSLNDSTFTFSLVISGRYTTVTLIVPRQRLDNTNTTVVDADVVVGTSSNLRSLGTLSGLRLNDTNKLYVQAVDIAGDRSKPLRFPSPGRTWYVKKPRGKLLIVADYIGGGDSSLVRRYYFDSVFARIPAVVADGFDFLNIRIGTTQTRSLGEYVPALQHINPAFIQMLRMYECVLWYTDGTPSYAVARYSLPEYCNAGGHLIFTMKFLNQYDDNGDPGNALLDIVPIDTLSRTSFRDTNGVSVTRFSGLIVPDSSMGNDIYPPLVFKLNIQAGICLYPVVKNVAARYLYYLPDSKAPFVYRRTPVAVMDERKRIIFLTLPLDRMSAVYPMGGGVIEFFKKAFRDFGIYQ
ncbi:MAG: hypothetical protein N3A63_07440 [Bacteroidetes bacterium]|nr:hypothetical protein [Bacteroidota bacterium]